MTTMLQIPEGILDTGVCGFHQYALAAPFHLTYASQNLCAMLGLSKEELVSDGADLYAATPTTGGNTPVFCIPWPRVSRPRPSPTAW